MQLIWNIFERQPNSEVPASSLRIFLTNMEHTWKDLSGITILDYRKARPGTWCDHCSFRLITHAILACLVESWTMVLSSMRWKADQGVQVEAYLAGKHSGWHCRIFSLKQMESSLTLHRSRTFMKSVVGDHENGDSGIGLLLFDEPSASLDPTAEHGEIV